MGTVRVVTLTNADPEFYPLLGPFFAQRSVIAELGAPPYDDPGKLWFIALEDDQVVGFAGVRFDGKNDKQAVFCSDYVVPERRRQGIHRQLMADRLEYVTGQAHSVVATVTSAGLRTYEHAGFTPTGRSGKMKHYTRMVRSLL